MVYAYKKSTAREDRRYYTEKDIMYTDVIFFFTFSV